MSEVGVATKKAGPPPPIDRPLARAYLRDFGSWSTVYSPGMSDPNTLREMNDVFRRTDGAMAVRPVMRSIFPDHVSLKYTHGVEAVGTLEPFFLPSGKAFLFAVRETSGVVGFRVAAYDTASEKYTVKTLGDAGFDVSDYGGLCFPAAVRYVKYLQIDNRIFALADTGEPLRMFWVGEDMFAKTLNTITEPNYVTADKLTVRHPDDAWVAGAQVTHPVAETKTTTTLISSDATKNVYNFAYFYTFNNEIGESFSSMVTIVKTQRAWSAWNADLADDDKSLDQLVASIPAAVWNNAVAQGAIRWNLYHASWSDQSPVPVEGFLIAHKPMVGAGVTYDKNGWIAHTPLLEGTSHSLAFPNETTNSNSTISPKCSNGLVAGDRMIVVNDSDQPARIAWTSNQQGEYSNFSPAVGGGYKTLTSGNIFVPSGIKLWQNPQSVDTITIMCEGVDGYSTSYYMAPAQVSGQSQNQQIMGFEETTNTPGTVSQYGNEVYNNALYHPLDWQLIKSTANNYNTSHKSMTDPIENKWRELREKKWIISSQLDTRLWYIVNNPDGDPLEQGCLGNEIWILDTLPEGGCWTRWKIQAAALHKLELAGKVYMGVIRPENIYVFDNLHTQDHTFDGDGNTVEVPVTWYFETNTQGANRAHDVWAMVQQVQVMLGNFQGTIKYGIKGWDVNGKAVTLSKIFTDDRILDLTQRPLPWDIEDFLLVRKNMREWRFFAESVPGHLSYGTVDMVQYRYTTSTANVGFELGSIETFEYARGLVEGNSPNNAWNGIPLPVVDQRHP